MNIWDFRERRYLVPMNASKRIAGCILAIGPARVQDLPGWRVDEHNSRVEKIKEKAERAREEP